MIAAAETSLLASSAPPSARRATRWVPVAAAGVALIAYATTAARTITWWDGSSYPLAAVTLGIPGAPGSLLLTLLGWLVSRIPIVHPVAFRLNLFAALLGATLVGVLTWLGTRLATPEGREPGASEHLAGALAGLTFAFGPTPWTYATQFTPYVLSTLWTALIIVAALAWWRRPERSSGRGRLFLLFLLLGLDASVHRTNSLLLPAVLLWVAIRAPSSGTRWRDAGGAATGLALGLAFHLLLIPLAARRPTYMVEDPSDLKGWWDYVSLEMKGGGFLMNLFPRRAGFLSVQVADYFAFLRRNLSLPLFLPAALAALGWLVTLPKHPRRALGMLAFFLCAGPGAIVYFNLPHAYMRPIDRHYLPSLVILAPWIAVGAATLMRQAARVPARAVLVPALVVAMTVMPLASFGVNRYACDLSRVRFAETFARDLLEPLPPHAILLTNGDNDTLPLWYLQHVEGVRSDVAVVNLPLANDGGYVARLRRNPDLSRLMEGQKERGVLPVLSARDTTVTTMVEPRTALGLPAGVAPPDSVTFHVSHLAGPLYGQDLVTLDILRLTRWRRPIYFACTVAPDNLSWLRPYGRLDGLAFRVVPSTDPSVWDIDHLRDQLFERVHYQGIADTTVRMDADTRALCANYASALCQLASAQLERGRARDALVTMRFLDERVPRSRLGVTPDPFAELRAHVEAEVARAAPQP